MMLDKIKRLNLKNLIKIATFLWGIVIIVAMSFWSIAIDEDFTFTKWIGNTLILVGIMVFGILMGETMGKDKSKEKPNGLYQINLNKYNTKRNEIDDKIIYFGQFYDWYLPQAIESKKVDYLVLNGMNKAKAERIVKYLTIDDFEKIKEKPLEVEDEEGYKYIIRKLVPSEYDSVEEVLNGAIKLDVSSSGYYLSAFETNSNVQLLEIGNRLEKDRKFNSNANRIIKIVFSVIISLVLGLYTYSEVNGGTAVVVGNLTTRLTTLFTSLLSGWLSGTIDVKLQAQILINKYDVLKLFEVSLEKKLFKTYTEEELAIKELEEQKQKEEEAIKNTIIPEIVEQPLPSLELKGE